MNSSDCTVYIGTIGQGVWRSRDGGYTFVRASKGMFMESEVRALAVPPGNDKVIFAGTDAGVYRSDDGGDNWERLDTPFDPGKGWQAGVVVWSLALHPRNPEVIFAGTCPPAIYRSKDGGGAWDQLDVELTLECGGILHPRVTTIVVDPTAESTVWAGVEIDGIRRSDDGGDTWRRLDAGLSSLDIHSLAVISPLTNGGRLVASTNNDLNLSDDGGSTWIPQKVEDKYPWRYCRGITSKPDDYQTLFLGNGDGPPGSAGAIQVSRDGGRSWSEAELSQPSNSTIWTFGTNAADANLIFALSVSGYVYRSTDGGAEWTKLPREFGEIRSVTWVPNS